MKSLVLALLCTVCHGWRDMPRGTKEEKKARFFARHADVCLWGAVPICTDGTAENVCQTEPGEDAPKKFNRGFRKGLFARAEYAGTHTFHFKNPDNADELCCRRGKLWKTIQAYKRSITIDQATKKECREIHDANESILGPVNRKKRFVGFCAVLRNMPEQATLLGFGVDLVCPGVIFENEFDSDEQMATFFAQNNRPRRSKKRPSTESTVEDENLYF